jgi:hypothetical protein
VRGICAFDAPASDSAGCVARKLAGMDLSQLYTDWLFTAAWADRIEQSTGIEDLEAYYRGRAQKTRK